MDMDSGDSWGMGLLATPLLLCAALSAPQWVAPPSGGADNDGFGQAVAVSGNLLLVGSPGRSVWGYRAGDVQAFFRFGEDWKPIGDVFPNALEAWDEFGSDIALDGDQGAIGCPGRDRVYLVGSVHGACFITGEIAPPPQFEGTRFGSSVAMHGNLLIIGAQLDDTGGLDAGAAHVYRHDGATWNHEAHLVPSEGVDFGWAGRSVAVHGDRVAFGANLEPVNGTPAAGSVYLYRHGDTDGWVLQSRLTHPDPGAGDYLGYDIAMDDTHLIAGAILANGPNDEEDIGAVVCWSLDDNGAALQSTVYPPDLIGGEFGYSVALDGGRMVVGAVFNPVAGPVGGAAYKLVLANDVWHWTGTLFPPSPQDGSQMGFDVALFENDVAAGCPRFESVPRAGRVRITTFQALCPGDANDSSTVDVADILIVIDSWGPCPACAGDVNDDGVVDTDDILLVIAHWGPCS